MTTLLVYTRVLQQGGIAVLCALLLAVVSVLPVGATGSSGNSAAGWCLPFKVPVALGAGQPYDQELSGTYCQPYRWSDKHQRPVDVMTSGAGYTGEYWDWGYKAETYSFARKSLASGRATLTYDRIGSGNSSIPHSTSLTLASDAHVLHQIITALRALGHKQVHSFGHSYGSAVVAHEAATYKDVSKVILTGFLHSPRSAVVGTRNYPANQDPKFVDAGLDNGYLTSRPGTRILSFYYQPTADPGVVAYDEATKSIISLNAFLGYVAQQTAPAASNITNTITVPILLVMGDKDAIFCETPDILNCSDQNAVRAFEAPYYTGAADFDVLIVPDTGHDINLHPSIADQKAGNQTIPGSASQINTWLKTGQL